MSEFVIVFACWRAGAVLLMSYVLSTSKLPKEHYMLRVFAFLQNRFEPVRRDDHGVTAVEYAILITVVGLALITTLTLFATQLGNFFSGFITSL